MAVYTANNAYAGYHNHQPAKYTLKATNYRKTTMPFTLQHCTMYFHFWTFMVAELRWCKWILLYFVHMHSESLGLQSSLQDYGDWWRYFKYQVHYTILTFALVLSAGILPNIEVIYPVTDWIDIQSYTNVLIPLVTPAISSFNRPTHGALKLYNNNNNNESQSRFNHERPQSRWWFATVLPKTALIVRCNPSTWFGDIL